MNDHPTLADFHDRFERAMATIRRGDWEATVPQQEGLIDLMRAGEPMLDRPQRDAYRAQAADRLGFTVERLAAILALPDAKLTRRALRVERVLRHSRLPDEEFYPTAGWIGEYLLWAQASEVPLGFHFWSAAACIGLAGGRQIYLDRGNHFVHLNHYLLYITDSGVGKGTAINPITTLMGAFNEHFRDHEKYHDGLNYRTVRFLSGDRVTMEKLADELTPGKRVVNPATSQQECLDVTGLLAPGELGTLLGKQVFAPAALVHFLTQIWDCETPFRGGSRMSGNIYLEKVALTLVAGCATDLVKTAISSELLSGGFIGRALFIHRDEPQRFYSFPQPLDPIAADGLSRSLADAMFRTPRNEAEWTPESRRWFHDWYMDMRRNRLDDPTLVGYYKRRDNHLLKLAIVLSISEGAFPTLSIPTLEKAWEILRYEESRMPLCLAAIAEHEGNMHRKRLLKGLGRLGGKATRSTWYRVCYRQYKGDVRKFKDAIRSVVELGDVIADGDIDHNGTWYTLVRWPKDIETEESLQ